MHFKAPLPAWDCGLGVPGKFCAKTRRETRGAPAALQTQLLFGVAKLWESVKPRKRNRRAGCRGAKGGNTPVRYIIPG